MPNNFAGANNQERKKHWKKSVVCVLCVCMCVCILVSWIKKQMDVENKKKERGREKGKEEKGRRKGRKERRKGE